MVDEENIDSWLWFITYIRELVTKRDGLCAKSDRYGRTFATMIEPHTGWEFPHLHHHLSTLLLMFENNFKIPRLKSTLVRQLVLLKVGSLISLRNILE